MEKTKKNLINRMARAMMLITGCALDVDPDGCADIYITLVLVKYFKSGELDKILELAEEVERDDG